MATIYTLESIATIKKIKNSIRISIKNIKNIEYYILYFDEYIVDTCEYIYFDEKDNTITTINKGVVKEFRNISYSRDYGTYSLTK